MTFREPRLARAVASALALAVLALGTARADEPIKEDWSILRMAGGNVGYVHTAVRKNAGASGAEFETSVDLIMTMKRLGSSISITSSQTTVEAENGRLIRIRATMKFSAQETLTEATFENGKARVATTSMGSTRESVVDCPPDAVGPYRVERLTTEKGLKPGTEFEVKTFMAEVLSAATVHVVVVGPEETELFGGEKQTLVKVEMTPDVLPVKTSAWISPDGTTQKTLTPMMGLAIESFRTTKEKALAASEGAETLSPDVFEKTLIRSTSLIPHPRTLDSALLRISPRTAGAALPALTDERQIIEKREAEGSILLRVSRLVPPSGKTGKRPLAKVPPEIADCLAPSSMVQSDDPMIVSIANEVIGGETDAWKAAQTLERWVEKNLFKKSMDVGFASAAEVCRNREGDCSEHSVLLAALCRAAGIPARSVMGVEYLAGIWGGHAWDEVWIEGRWYPLDATNGFGFVDPLHLGFSKMTLKEGSGAKEFGALIQGLGAIDIEVLEASYKGRTLRPSSEDSVRVEGDRYENRLWGFACSKPQGFSFDLKKPTGQITNRLLDIEGKTASGDHCEIHVSASPISVDFKIEDAPKMLGADGGSEKDLKIDGRPAKLSEASKDGKKRRFAAVVDGDSFFVFTLTNPESDAETRAFDTFLQSIDFDVVDSSKN